MESEKHALSGTVFFFRGLEKTSKLNETPGRYAPDFYFCFIFEKIRLKIASLLEIFHYIN
jgi:hypothetical protein